ncbi:FG-GAP repeat-containing protein [Maridesulfovibrio ferrireducens]|uniref:FG-GAP repeat-containing protein n=1 Tax=Maridesulfovibrio ferrireducens TaxID=246191 RepID=A0A1G9BAW2_9BACT|nr:hypothetical protein [Maridesulfovibrio ferrireducens]SDK36583.1 FG-GAP repeat-containing protein [Maridesulfovibrio ferrireducens]
MNKIYLSSKNMKIKFLLLLLCFLLLPTVSMASWDKVPEDTAFKIQQNLHDEMCKFVKTDGAPAAASTVDGQLQLSADRTAPRFKSGKSWFALTLDSLGRAGAMKKATTPTIKTEGAKLSLERKGVTEWYINHGSNLEHGLILTEKPVGNGQLEFSFATSGNLTPKQNGKDISFVGGKTLNYAGIKSWDSAGTELVCAMSVKDGVLIWSVDDSKAKYPVTIDPTVSIAKKLTARTDVDGDDIEAGARFGHRVSVSGDVAIVGAYLKDEFAVTDVGVAYIFSKNQGGANNWGIVKKIVATKDDGSGDFDGLAYNYFGKSVSVSGDNVIVGAPGDDDPADSGSAYIFSKDQGGVDNWGIVKKITAGADADAGAAFGDRVSISGDIVLVGAYLKDKIFGDLNRVGAAYIFSKDQGGTSNWGMVKKITARTDADADDTETDAEFGSNVSISGDIALVGARNKDESGKADAGAGYIFFKDQGGVSNWGIVKKITARTEADADDTEVKGSFGHSVSVSGDLVLVGAYGNDATLNGSAYIFSKDQGGADKWGIVKKLTAKKDDGTDDGEADARFGYSVSLFGDVALVSAYRKDEPGLKSGAAYIFSKDQGGNGNWGIIEKITAEKTDGTSDIEASAFFGWNVSLSGEHAIVGAYGKVESTKANVGAAYVYNVIVNDNPVIPVENQPSGTVVTIDSANKKVQTKAEVTAQYQSVNMDSMLGANVYAFNATVTSGQVAYFCFNSTSLGERRAGDVALFKLFTDKASKTFTYSADKMPTEEGRFWITDEANSGQYMDPNMVLTGGQSYTVNYSVKDNGEYDINDTLGKITDPVVPGTTSSDSSGCVMNPQAGFSIELAGLFLVALAGVFLRLFRRKKCSSSQYNRYFDDFKPKKYLFPVVLFCFLLFPTVSMASWDSVPEDTASKIQQNLHDEMCKFVKNDGAPAVASTVDGQLQLSADTTATRFKSGDNWFALSLKSFGRTGAMKKATTPTMNTEGAKLSLERKGLTEWYINHGRNLEHGLVLNEKPAGNGQLEFYFATSGNLTPKQNGKDISFVGGKTLNYAGIKSWDSAGTELVCSMSVKNGALVWSVDDSKAKYPVTIDPTVSIAKKLTAVGDVEAGANFGCSVSISGDVAIVGAYLKDEDNVNSAGAAYIFSKDQGGDGTWGLVQKLVSPESPVAAEFFGQSVSISGDVAIVGAAYTEGIGERSGAAYIFSKNPSTGWGFVKKLTATKDDGFGTEISDERVNAYFGSSVSVSGDVAIVGATYNEEPDGSNNLKSNAGAVYIFSKGTSTGWGFVKKITARYYDASGTEINDVKINAYFGSSVSVSGDVAIVGAKNDGSAYIYYNKLVDGWTIAKKLKPRKNDGTYASCLRFGNSVSISGDLALVGDYDKDEFDLSGRDSVGAAYIFSKDQDGLNKWGCIKKLTATKDNGDSDIQEDAHFGDSVSISGDIAIVGSAEWDASASPADADVGAAYIFSKDQGGTNDWGIVKKITATKDDGDSDIQEKANFGCGVSVSGNIAIVGASKNNELDAAGVSRAKAGAAYTYTITNNHDKIVVPATAQPSGTVVTIDNCCKNVHTKTEVEEQYQSVNMDAMLGANVYEFNATVTSGQVAYFCFNSSSLGERRAGNVALFKLFTDKASKTFTYSADKLPTEEGSFWITDETNSGQYMDPNMVLTGGQTYTVNYSVKDNGEYDINTELGKITDPVVLGASSSSGDSGCVLNPRADLSIELAGLCLIALVGMVLRRRKGYRK